MFRGHSDDALALRVRHGLRVTQRGLPLNHRPFQRRCRHRMIAGIDHFCRQRHPIVTIRRGLGFVGLHGFGGGRGAVRGKTQRGRGLRLLAHFRRNLQRFDGR
ncbi:hypothetical protein D3C81_1761900 [compost metagenome]